MPDVIDVRNVIYDIYEVYGNLTYIICMYVNMGVKRSVRTSGMQRYPDKLFLGSKTGISDLPTIGQPIPR